MEFEEDKKTIKSINLDDFSIEDLEEYTVSLKDEIQRVKDEIDKKNNLKEEARKFFK